jgi:hydroxymethylglutaryl-CoA lyase
VSSTKVHITDVTLRDGLQMEKSIAASLKLALFDKLVACGYDRLEVTSFSHPKWMPQFADSEAFCQLLYQSPKKLPDLEWMAFVPNERGLERLLAYPIPWVSAFVAASETFNQKNVNADIATTLTALKPLVVKAQAAGRKVRLYVSTVFGCPYEGAIDEAKLFTTLNGVAALNPDEIALSDTIGVALPGQVRAIVKKFANTYPIEKTALHLHDTYGLAVAGCEAGFEVGIRRFDGSTGSIGGCPYAKGATGNVAAEELQYLFRRLGAVPEFRGTEIQAALETLRTDLGLTVKSRLNDIWQRGGTLYGVR